MVPYHDVRWQSAASLFSQCLVVEMTNRDEFRALELQPDSGTSYGRITLFPNVNWEGIPKRQLAKRMRGLLSRERPDVIFVNGYSFFYNWVALKWGLRHQVPVVVCSESNEHDEPRQSLKEGVKRFFVNCCAAGLAGGTLQVAYLEKLGLPRERLFTGYDVVDNSFFARKAGQARARDRESENFRKSLRLPGRYFFACARFGKKKNIPGLIKAFSKYREKASEDSESSLCELVIAGDGEERSLIEQVLGENGVAHHVHLIGSKGYEELPSYYGLAEAFIHASTTEQWGLVANEAMASGLPVLVSNRCGCVPDLLQEGVNGWSFDPGDQEQLTSLMLKISSDSRLRKEMGTRSDEIIANWGPARFAQGVASAGMAAIAAPKRKLVLWDQLIFTLMALR